MSHQHDQAGISLNGFIVFLLVFIVVAFGAGWLANKYYSNRLFLVNGTAADFPSLLNIDARPDGLAWNGQSLVFSNRATPWGLVRITPLENGQYNKTSIPVVDTEYHQQVSLQGVSWNGTVFIALTSGDWFQSDHRTVFVELDPLTLQISKVLGEAPDFAHCVAWDGQNYWAGTRFHTEDQKGNAALYKFDQDLNLVKQFKGAGKGCQGMTWDGKFLWWGDVFANTITLFDIYNSTNVSPVIVHQYTTSIKQLSGIAFDGKDIWIGDDKNAQLNRLNQDLYFDWLGGHYEISDPAQLIMLERFDNYQTGEMQLDDLIKPLLEAKVKAIDIPDYVETLRSRYSGEEIRQILQLARDKVSPGAVSSALQDELIGLVDSGEIDYVDNAPVEADSVKIQYFNATIENGNLLANWKVIAGNEIVAGIDAPRPQQIPDDYDFYTFIQYTIIIKDLQTGIELEQEFDIFGDEEVKNDVVLMQNIKPGEYLIDIAMRAQYYTESTASHYNSKLEINITY